MSCQECGHTMQSIGPTKGVYWCPRCGTVKVGGEFSKPRLPSNIKIMREALHGSSPLGGEKLERVHGGVHAMMFILGITEATMKPDEWAAYMKRKNAFDAELQRTYKPGVPGKEFEW